MKLQWTVAQQGSSVRAAPQSVASQGSAIKGRELAGTAYCACKRVHNRKIEDVTFCTSVAPTSAMLVASSRDKI